MRDLAGIVSYQLSSIVLISTNLFVPSVLQLSLSPIYLNSSLCYAAFSSNWCVFGWVISPKVNPKYFKWPLLSHQLPTKQRRDKKLITKARWLLSWKKVVLSDIVMKWWYANMFYFYFSVDFIGPRLPLLQDNLWHIHWSSSDSEWYHLWKICSTWAFKNSNFPIPILLPIYLFHSLCFFEVSSTSCLGCWQFAISF